ncbi:hypothetical protein SAMD00019534_009860 [Acytostelium subglobosum LB1]|uniref:hypothetical protein n=1 Tax=Acytostelium subglobosum LB1 TaxID=1410327 RepID=UPI000644B4D5|nr:hypothetical protein SAMD00019534_009860 [Acytostelium subglobosum LB1]GAM17811.1 hypothetical protein SAMD00019534_009860 [Acytostelium subglobosum LB1]|eukprot:XP_012758407.1 hypothetical protein SAMD00019534_009860 [Acytostelium subglobosum LB1]
MSTLHSTRLITSMTCNRLVYQCKNYTSNSQISASSKPSTPTSVSTPSSDHSFYLKSPPVSSSLFGVNNVVPGSSGPGKAYEDSRHLRSRASPLAMSKEIKAKIFDQENIVSRDMPTQYHSEARSFKVLEVDLSGNLIDQIIFKNNLSIEMKLQARDLRTIDSSFPPQMPAILARDKVFIVSIGYIRAIVQHDKIIFFDPQNPLIRNDLVPILREYLGNQNLFFTETLTLPFEFKVLEAMLVFICKKLTAEHQRICTLIAKELESLNENPEHNLENLLLFHKKGLNQFEVTTKEIMDALSRLLESDEDMALMYLSFRSITGGTRKRNQHEELEILLENYMRQLEQISNEISQLKETLSSTEEFVNFQLDTARNKMMRMNLTLSLVTMSAGMGSMVTGFFGMNLMNGFEHAPFSFFYVSGGVLLGGLSVFAYVKWYCHKHNILPYSKKPKFRVNGMDSFQNPFLHSYNGGSSVATAFGTNHYQTPLQQQHQHQQLLQQQQHQQQLQQQQQQQQQQSLVSDPKHLTFNNGYNTNPLNNFNNNVNVNVNGSNNVNSNNNAYHNPIQDLLEQQRRQKQGSKWFRSWRKTNK